MRAMVTGSTGLLGNNLVRALHARGVEVRALARSRAKFDYLVGDALATCVVGDMRRIDAWEEALEGCDMVFHTAAYFREYYAPGDHAEALQAINVDGTLALMQAADRRRVSAFVHTSSSGAVGKRADGEPGDENTPPSATHLKNLYFRSKVDGDARIQAFRPSSGMRVVEILPGWMFGPGDAGPTSAGKLLRDLVDGKLPGVPRGGASVVDARDVVQAMVRAAAAAHGERYLVAGRTMSLREVVDELAEAAGVASPRFDMPPALALSFSWLMERLAAAFKLDSVVSVEGVRVLLDNVRFSSEKAKRELGIEFRPFAETARDVVAWAQTHEHWQDTAASDVPQQRSPTVGAAG